MSDYIAQFHDILESCRIKISQLKPSDWAEKRIIMNGAFPGPLKYDGRTPFNREIIDCCASDHPARDIAIMGSAQFGKTTTIIVPAIGYIMENDPGNIIMTVGHEDLMDDALGKIEYMLDTTGLRSLIKSSAQRAKSQKTGDTNTIKEFTNGYLRISAASNPKIWRQASYKYGFIDDYEAVRNRSKIAGDVRSLIGKRFTAYENTRKTYYLSSPELEHSSNILEVYLLGDQRKFMVPCPCCGEFIELKWSVEGREGEACGIIWQMDEENSLIESSVAYKCQSCLDVFTDQLKSEFIDKGYWKPTAKPLRPDFYSYYMNGLYAPHGMSGWVNYVYKYIECCPAGQRRNESKYQAFLNLDLGEPYKAASEAPQANEIQNNIRNYEIGIIPEKISIEDGNGKIVLLTCACDLNGIEEDARLDWEVVAWSESGASYSVDHGCIGTFIPLEATKKYKEDREHWTYHHNQANSVWREFDKIVDKIWDVDTGRRMKIFITGVDTGHYTNHAYAYVDNSNFRVVSLKGEKESKYTKYGIDVPTYKVGKERANLFLVHGGLLKDELSTLMKLKYDPSNDEKQPYGFMNYPMASGNKYQYKNFFSHYESEYKEPQHKDGELQQFIWKKKSPTHQNHFFDVRVYNMVLKDIAVFLVCKDLKIKNYGWNDYVDVVLTS